MSVIYLHIIKCLPYLNVVPDAASSIHEILDNGKGKMTGQYPPRDSNPFIMLASLLHSKTRWEKGKNQESKPQPLDQWLKF
jgi:hypothetical protein